MDTSYNNVLNKTSDAEKSNLDRLVENGEAASGVVRESVTAAGKLAEQTTENVRQISQSSMQEATRQAQQFGDQFRNAFGFGTVTPLPWAEQSKQNLEAVTRGGAVLAQAFQDVSRSWLELSQNQLRRNGEGLQTLAGVQTPQEFVSVQTELFREGMQHLIEDSCAITERSVRAAQEASTAFANTAVPGFWA